MGSHPDSVAPVHHGTAPHHGHRHYARVAHHAGTFHRLVTTAARHDASHDAHHDAHHDAGPVEEAPAEVAQALRTAMEIEGVPNSWEDGLRFIMHHESGSRVGVANKTDSARGLFQLTRSSYDFNPNGASSFGNAVEEAQGGIRYIKQRYQTADNAVQFWQRHRYY